MAYLSRLTLTAFRNYSQLRLSPGPGPILVTGHNGAGKTNLLEAISLLGPGRGMRGARLSEMAQAGTSAPWGVAAELETRLGTCQLGTGAEAGSERRTVRIDGANRLQGSLTSIVSVLWLTPAMDRLFNEPSSARRKFLDRLVYGYDAEHATRVNRYEHALRERSKLLEAERHPAWLDGIETLLAESGVAIAVARARVAQRLDEACDAEPSDFPVPRLAMQGELETWLAEMPALAVEDRYRAALADSRGLDRATGRSAIGAHRSDLAVTYRDKAMPAASCSTGEQKGLLIALMMANAALMARTSQGKPVLLLDEIGAHLDAPRRAALFGRIQALDLQAWMTGTDLETFGPLADAAQCLTVDHGQVNVARGG